MQFRGLALWLARWQRHRAGSPHPQLRGARHQRLRSVGARQPAHHDPQLLIERAAVAVLHDYHADQPSTTCCPQSRPHGSRSFETAWPPAATRRPFWSEPPTRPPSGATHANCRTDPALRERRGVKPVAKVARLASTAAHATGISYGPGASTSAQTRRRRRSASCAARPASWSGSIPGRVSGHSIQWPEGSS